MTDRIRYISTPYIPLMKFSPNNEVNHDEVPYETNRQEVNQMHAPDFSDLIEIVQSQVAKGEISVDSFINNLKIQHGFVSSPREYFSASRKIQNSNARGVAVEIEVLALPIHAARELKNNLEIISKAVPVSFSLPQIIRSDIELGDEYQVLILSQNAERNKLDTLESMKLLSKDRIKDFRDLILKLNNEHHLFNRDLLNHNTWYDNGVNIFSDGFMFLSKVDDTEEVNAQITRYFDTVMRRIEKK